MRIETTQPNRDLCPPGLLFVADLLARIPERKRDLLDHEIAKRERERTLTHETRHLLSWHPLHTTKTVALYGFHGFILAWVIGLLASLGRSYAALQTTKIKIPLPLVNDIVFNLGSFVPTSTTLGIASQLPVWSFRTALVIGIGIAVIVAVEKIVFAALQWKKVRALQASEADLHQEIETLKEWKREL
ncbi:MAG TPA: hypothetical protein VN397_02120 [Candidatus Methylomirabilis sp.]|nr:hypothetical protein [Candidatus Methylomirabilis sp.]